MKKGRNILVAMVSVLLLSGCALEQEVMLADGRATLFSHWEGRWMLINYWAEWCAPCRKEIPDLNRLHNERTSTGVVILGVNYDGLRGDKLKTLVEEMNIDFPVLVDDPRLRWEQELPPVLPTTLVINPAGELQEVLVGPHSYESFSAVLKLTATL